MPGDDAHRSIRIPKSLPKFLIGTARDQFARSLGRGKSEADAFEALLNDPRLAEVWKQLLARHRDGDEQFLHQARAPEGSEIEITDKTIIQHAAMMETLVQIFLAARIYWESAPDAQSRTDQLRQDAARFQSARPRPIGKKLAKKLLAAADAYECARDQLSFQEFERSVATHIVEFFGSRFNAPAMHGLAARITSILVGKDISEATVRQWVRPPRKRTPPGKSAKKR